MATLHLDFETRSAADLRRVGAVRYAMDPSTEVLVACYAFEEDGVMSPVECWRRGDPPPAALLEAVRNGSVVCAHNAMFELAVWTYVCTPRMGWPTLSPYQMDCTMARAHVMSLLGGLEQATKLLRLPVTKNPNGRRLIHLFSVPRRPAKNEPAYDTVRWNEPEDHAADFNEFVAYCADDVRAECGLDKALPKLSDREREIFHFDLVVNLRGFAMDTAMLRKAAAFVDEAKARLDQEISDLTEGAVTSTTQTERIKAWLAARGVHVTSIGKGEAENIIAQTRVLGDDTAERVFELRRLGAKKTSLQKFNRALECIGFDGRARGLLTYHKAGTGRWAGAIYQPHNLQRFDYDNDWPLIEHMLTVLHDEGSARVAVDWCSFLGHQPMQFIGKMQRAMIVAPEGREFIGADYSNVEGRGSAWNAGETWKVQAFIDYDRGIGPDLYKLAYSRSFGVPIDDVTKAGRQIGKVQELALGYQGAVGAYISMSANYGIKPQDILAAVKPIATPEGWDAAAAKYARSAKHGLDEDTWTALRYVVDGWRGGHPRTVQAWWDIQDLVVGAVSEPGVMHYMLNNRVRAYCARNMSFLYIFLPSGRPLSYFRPRIKIPLEEAETIKLGKSSTQYPRKKLNDIMLGRLEDMFDLVIAHLKKIGKHELLPAGIVLTGGGSGIETIEDFARAAMKLPSKIPSINLDLPNSTKSKKQIKDTSWFVAYGLAIWGVTNDRSSRPSGVSMWSRIRETLSDLVKQLLP